MPGLDRLSKSQTEIVGYTIGTDFRICRPNSEQCEGVTKGGGTCASAPCREGEEYAPAIGSEPLAITSAEIVVDKPEMIGLDGIMIIIVDLHGGLHLPIQPINPDSFTNINLASIAAAPPGLSNMALPEFTRFMHVHYIDTGLKERIKGLVEKNITDNLQKIEGIATVPDSKSTKKEEIANRKKMSLVSPDLCVLMLNELRQYVKDSFAESFSKWGRDSPHAQAALANPEERYRSLNIIKGFGVEPGVASLPYKKYVTYHDKNDAPQKMGVTTMTFHINKNNKVTCSKMFIPADKFMPSIKYEKQQDPEGGFLYSATMEKLINHFIEFAYNKKFVISPRTKTPETIVTMDLTCSICSDGRVLEKPLDEYRPRPGGGNNKTKKTKNKRRTYR